MAEEINQLTLSQSNINSNYLLYRQNKIIDKSNVTGTYTPVWTTISGAAPSLGDGILAGQYYLNNNICHVNIEFEAGSSTTFGTEDWRFSLPFTASATEFSLGTAYMRDDDTGTYYTGIVDKVAGNTVQVLFNNNSAGIKNNNPFTWTDGDALNISITYHLE